MLADTDPDAGAWAANGLPLELGCNRSFSCPLNVLPRGFRLWGELVPAACPEGDDVRDLRSFRRSSVSRSFASRPSSSALWEETACFLNLVSFRSWLLLLKEVLLFDRLHEAIEIVIHCESIVQRGREVASHCTEHRLAPIQTQ